GARLATRHRRIDKLETKLLCLRVEFARDFGRGRGVVDEGGAFLHSRERAVRAKRDGTQVVVVADAGHDEVLAFGCGLRRRRVASLEFLRPCLGLGRRPVEDRYIMAALDDQMPCHGETHDAETEKSDFGHLCNPEISPAHWTSPD